MLSPTALTATRTSPLPGPASGSCTCWRSEMRPALSMRQLVRITPPFARRSAVRGSLGAVLPPRKAAMPAVKTPEMKLVIMRI